MFVLGATVLSDGPQPLDLNPPDSFCSGSGALMQYLPSPPCLVLALGPHVAVWVGESDPPTGDCGRRRE